MPSIYLRHSRHGDKVAIAEAEAVADERNGWVRYTPGAVEPESEPESVPEFLQTENALIPKRRGRPPKVQSPTM